jgi:hypothetical protein
VLTDEVITEILSATVTPPPQALQAQGVTHWSSRRLADWLARTRKIQVSHDSISRLWRRFGLQPHRTEGFKFSTDPRLEAKVRDVVGLSSILLRTRWWSAWTRSPSARPWNGPSRSCRLDPQAGPAIQAARPKADFAPGSDDKRAWLSLSASNEILAKAASGSANVP